MSSISNKCYGCEACVQICPQKAILLVENNEGFYYPKVDLDKCNNCGLCKQVCPINHVGNSNPEIETYAFKHNCDGVRRKSASGGAFSALSDIYIKRGGKVYGVIYDGNFNAKFACATTFQERNKMRDSKYVQAYIGNTYVDIGNDLLKGNKDVLFVGTPCQVAGLKKFLEGKGISQKKLVTVDLICHGVPSPKLFKEYIAFCEKVRRRKIKKYYHRKKLKRWGNWSEGICYENNEIEFDSALSQVWRHLYMSNLISRLSCYECPFKSLNRVGDLTIGDFWNGEREIKDFLDYLGVSIILVNSENGKKVLNQVTNGKKIKCKTYAYQVNLRYSTKCSVDRVFLWQDYYKKGFAYIAKKYGKYNLKEIVEFYVGKKNGNQIL